MDFLGQSGNVELGEAMDGQEETESEQKVEKNWVDRPADRELARREHQPASRWTGAIQKQGCNWKSVSWESR